MTKRQHLTSSMSMDVLPLCPRQASAAGLSHSGLLRHLYNLAAERHGVPVLPPLTAAEADDLAVNPYAVFSKDEAAAMHLTDDKGNLSLWTPPPDHAWDHFRTELEEGTATMGLWQHDYLPNNQACADPPLSPHQQAHLLCLDLRGRVVGLKPYRGTLGSPLLVPR